MSRRPGCVFCDIAAGEAPADVVGETGQVIAFHDIHPAAPVHVLLVPRDHVARSAADLGTGHAELLGELFGLAAGIAEDAGVADEFRLVTNSGRKAGQSVFHLHFHLLGGWSRSSAGPRRLADERGG